MRFCILSAHNIHKMHATGFQRVCDYTGRFGLVYIDYPTLRRIPKDFFHWYREVIQIGTVRFPTQE